MNYPHAKIVRQYKKSGTTFTEVLCPYCGRLELHCVDNADGEVRYSHCGGPGVRGLYIMTKNTESVEPLASRKARCINRVLSGDLPSGLIETEFGFQVDNTIAPPDTERHGQLSRLIDALDSYTESAVQL